MLVYESIKRDFGECVLNDCIVDKIKEKYIPKFGNPSKSEERSWKNSMNYMFKVLSSNDIPDNSGVAIEFNIPYTSKRVDFIITGKDSEDKESAVIIELKQWEKVEVVKGKDGIVKTFLGGSNRETTHPSYQAWSYASVISDFNEIVQKDEIKLVPCAYLHNYKKKKENDPLLNEIYQYYIKKAPIYSMGEIKYLQKFILKHIKTGDNKEVLYKIENGKLKPSKSLQDSISSMLKDNDEFIMIDEQKVVFEKAMEMALQSKTDQKKRVLIVEGGPGTGKTVLAINLLAKFLVKNIVCQYATKNAAPRKVFIKKLKKDFKSASIDNLFKGTGSYTQTPKNFFDSLIIDEAHRLNEKSGMFANLGENQIKEIIYSSKFSMFFIDECQRVTIKDIGSVAEIEKYANNYKAEIVRMELESQFRCNGSDGYLSWIDNLLDIRKTANYDGFEDYEFKIFDNPLEMKNAIIEKNKIANKSRVLAGYCWDWTKESKNKSDYYDIEIDEFRMSWNLNNTDTWAIDENSVNQAGCIHTSQGLEFDYVGIIIGNDLRCENNEIITDFFKRAKTDQSLKGIKGLYKREPDKAMKIADEIIKNTYRTLLTRGQKGCYLYCVDNELCKYFKNKLN